MAAWEAAVPANRTDVHPYLEAKHIDQDIDEIRVLKKGTAGLKIMGDNFEVVKDILLIRCTAKKGTWSMSSASSTGARGTGLKLRSSATYFYAGIGYLHTNDTIYLARTGLQLVIAQCAQAFCAVAFTMGGLLARRGTHRGPGRKVLPELIIAADNDRWTSSRTIRPTPRPLRNGGGEAGRGASRDPRLQGSVHPADKFPRPPPHGASASRQQVADPAQADRALTVLQPGQEPIRAPRRHPGMGEGCSVPLPRGPQGHLLLHPELPRGDRRDYSSSACQQGTAAPSWPRSAGGRRNSETLKVAGSDGILQELL